MKKINHIKRTFLAAFLLGTVMSIHAQETILASGSEATGSGGASSYSVGQLVYTTNAGSGGTLNQGIQQSVELFTLSNPELSTVNLSAMTYPNPTSNDVVLKISDSTLDSLSYKLIDISGKVVAIGKISHLETQIDMQQLVIGIYILRVSQNNQELKAFKIIKK